jgi:ferredoxin
MFTHAGAPTPIKCDLCLKCTEVCNTDALTVVK